MDKKVSKELDRAKRLLSQAMGVALNSLPNNAHVKEARTHVNQAIAKLDIAQQKVYRKRLTMTEYEKWWSHIQTGAAKMASSNQTSSPQATQRTLDELNRLIAAEQAKLGDVEKLSQEIDTELLND